MYLTQDQAKITLYTFSSLSYREIEEEVAKLKAHSTGQYSLLLMPTGNKLKFDTAHNKFYLDGYANSDTDNVYIYEALELLEDYWEFLVDNDYTQEEIDTRKKYYQGYKESIEYQAA